MMCLTLFKLGERHLEVSAIENFGKTKQLEEVGSIKINYQRLQRFLGERKRVYDMQRVASNRL